MRIITGRARGLQLTAPKNMDVRPTADRVKESLFNIIGSRIIEAEILDLFAGTGNLGLESWSRGARKITFIDESRESLRLVQSNITKCRAQADCTVLKGNAVNVMERLSQQGMRFDFIFCDPPYNKGWIAKVLDTAAKSPVIKNGGYLVIERSQHEEIKDLPKQFEIVRTEKYGETFIDFVCYNSGDV